MKEEYRRTAGRPARLLCAALAVTALSWAGVAPAADAAADQAAVRRVLMAQFDKPEARLTVEPVVVSGQAAVAGWAQGDRGGRALLFRKHGSHWQIALCAGDALRTPKLMIEAGVKPRDAEAIAKALAAGEARLTPAQRARFSTFDGIVRLDGSGQHPPAHKP